MTQYLSGSQGNIPTDVQHYKDMLVPSFANCFKNSSLTKYAIYTVMSIHGDGRNYNI